MLVSKSGYLEYYSGGTTLVLMTRLLITLAYAGYVPSL